MKQQLSDFVVASCIESAEARNRGEDYGFPCGNANHAVITLGKELQQARVELSEANAKLSAIADNFGAIINPAIKDNPPMGGPIPQSEGWIINGVIDGQIAGYLKYKITPTNLGQLLGRAATELNDPTMGASLADKLLRILLPTFQ